MERLVIEVDGDLKHRIKFVAATRGITIKEMLSEVLFNAFPLSVKDEVRKDERRIKVKK